VQEQAAETGALGEERDARMSERALDPALRLQNALEMAFRYLEGKRVEPETIEQALASLREQGYLDDVRFAREFTEDKRLLEEWGADRIERRLLALGLPVEIVRGAVGARGRDDEREAAMALVQRRFPALENDPRELKRAIGVLARKGYDSELAWDVVRAHARGGDFD
jgi:regulatory protein